MKNNTLKGILRGAFFIISSWIVGLAIGTIIVRSLPVAPINHIDPQVGAYVFTFLIYAEKYNVPINHTKLKNLRVNVRPLPWYLNISGNTIGLCEYSTVHIALDSTYWKEANHLEREMLVFHELSHCLFEMGHVNGEDHIMNPTILSAVTYGIFYQKLMDKLFNCTKNCPVVHFNRRNYL